MHDAARWTAYAALGVLALPLSARAQTGFEGTMTFVTHSRTSAKVDTVVQTVKGNAIRMSGMGGRGGGMIIDGDKKQMMVLDDQHKMAMVMSQADQEKMKAMGEAAMKNRPKAAAPKPEPSDAAISMTKTGKTETVAGYRCEVFHVKSTRKDTDREGDVCIADGVGFALFSAMASNPMFQSSQRSGFAEYKALVGNGKGLVKSTSIENGKSVVELEMIKVDKQRVPASTFEAPAGYQVQSMGDVMGRASAAMQQMQQQMQQQQGAKKKPPM